ncbi:hypothetical protein AC578_190 [Pseudocercospora eumusae]|uniref:Uncharacterized protein n=1 Tax=Pseudocercospora eumusae TaxID=321146 RepID=A0A139HIT7_9PEZI|nr:hypothetical protein AC578_190 [Pseudocercospora eumusae]
METWILNTPFLNSDLTASGRTGNIVALAIRKKDRCSGTNPERTCSGCHYTWAYFKLYTQKG